MKKILSLTALVLALGAMPLLSQADPTCAPVAGAPISGTACVDDADQSLTVDGDVANPDPLDGYVRVDSTGACYAEADGAFGEDADGDGDADNGTCQEAVEDNLP